MDVEYPPKVKLDGRVFRPSGSNIVGVAGIRRAGW
jgi:hypothetical protein